MLLKIAPIDLPSFWIVPSILFLQPVECCHHNELEQGSNWLNLVLQPSIVFCRLMILAKFIVLPILGVTRTLGELLLTMFD